jgi:hypothetical protein
VWLKVSLAPRAASLVAIKFSAGPDLYLVMVLLVTSLLSFGISRVLYVRAIRARV